MNFNEYQKEALRTAKEESLVDALVHASLGLASETGEFTSTVKRAAKYGKEITPKMRENMLEELGDTLWYIALAATALGASFESLAVNNTAKLRIRYPVTFSPEAAEARADKGGLPHTQS